MVRYPEPASCNNCAARGEEDAMTACPHCGLTFCKACYPEHHGMEKTAPLPANPALSQKTNQAKTTTIIDSSFTAAHPSLMSQTPPIPKLRGTQGTPAPAAANPFIFKRGTGRPDEPPEEAGAPNRPAKEPAPMTMMIAVRARQ